MRAITFILAVVVLTSSGCLNLKMPQVTGISKLRLSDITKDTRIQFDVGLRNPNAFGVTLKSMKAELFLADSSIAGIGVDRKTRLAANQHVDLPFSVQPKLTALPQLGILGITQLFKKDNKKISLRGELKVRKFIFTKKVKFSIP
ncbi:MAG: LEA type 2 family protein [Bacteroidetes bacterium]|jgi:LEA14-like dessication related protein|nr:LEA type 2 family protein [Bacteroidota bacterium]MBX7237885.1 LEA type 2 family protein [Bacteroidia bacterium]MCC7515594.1 LEA type 2 family protein [Bacteroidia bacterium]MCW5919888.1 LEA type 2 family protein [Bacteroidota bacterium]HMU77934.1 LEA type 2 family protein [Bacteroidia bacterium]